MQNFTDFFTIDELEIITTFLNKIDVKISCSSKSIEDVQVSEIKYYTSSLISLPDYQVSKLEYYYGNDDDDDDYENTSRCIINKWLVISRVRKRKTEEKIEQYNYEINQLKNEEKPNEKLIKELYEKCDKLYDNAEKYYDAIEYCLKLLKRYKT